MCIRDRYTPARGVVGECHESDESRCSYPYYYEAAKYAFAIPVLGIVIITILNDGCMLTIARDHVVAAGKPQSWDLPQLRAIATACGMVPLFSSLLLLYMGLSSADGLYPWYAKFFGVKVDSAFQNAAGDRYYMPYEQVRRRARARRSPFPLLFLLSPLARFLLRLRD